MDYQWHTGTQAPPERSLADLFSELSEQASILVRQEIQLAQTEMTRKATKAGRNVGVVVAGGIVALAAFYSIVAALILALSQVMDGWLAALIVAVTLAIVAALLVQYGLNKLKQIDPAPRRTIETMRENKEWLSQQV